MRCFFCQCLFFWGIFSPFFAFGSETLGARAYEYTREILSFGPRSIFDRGHKQTGDFIQRILTRKHFQIKKLSFKAKTPMGEKRMANYWGKTTPLFSKVPTVVFMAHYDSKYFPNISFLGANDAASAVGLLLALAEFYAKNPIHVNLEFVFLDGEEALKSWSEKDSLYGSRWLSHLWSLQNRQKEITSMILLDMIGGSQPTFCREIGFSDPALSDELWAIAKSLGLEMMFSSNCTSHIEDDHVPFSQKGFSTVDIISYPFPEYWHKSEDRLDVVDPESLSRVGQVLQGYLESLETKN